MRFTVTFKDPDACTDDIAYAVQEEVEKLGLNSEEGELVAEKRCERVAAAISKFVKHGESITVEFDTEAGTATVKEAK